MRVGPPRTTNEGAPGRAAVCVPRLKLGTGAVAVVSKDAVHALIGQADAVRMLALVPAAVLAVACVDLGALGRVIAAFILPAEADSHDTPTLGARLKGPDSHSAIHAAEDNNLFLVPAEK